MNTEKGKEVKYIFDDMTIYTLTTKSQMEVFKESKDKTTLDFWFAVDAKDADEIDIVALHDNKYFE